MLCYRDMTFCKSDCTNKQCPRFVTQAVRERADFAGLPLALADMSKDCKEYLPPENNDL